MKNLWSDSDAKAAVAAHARKGIGEDLALRVYTTRLLGGEPKLVLHGGGNTSVKTRLPDISGRTIDVLCVKGSGWDMGTIEAPGLPAVRLAPLRELHGLQALPSQVIRQFNQALAAGNLGKAGDMLANLAELAPGDAVQGALGNRLASAWLDQAEQQLARGDRIGASQSLERARKLSPSNPRVLDLGARLQGGG